jgi:carboxymethylenebutenolidase
MGGALALHAACSLPAEIGACVDFYGVHPNIHPDYARLRAPVLGLFGEHDAFVTPAVARAIQAGVQKHGGQMDVHSYDAGHAFFNDARPEAYKAGPAQDAWQKVLGFFATNL